MAAVINTNYLSLVAQNNLNKSQSALGTAIERLSSGLRINSAKDDAAGMAIANRFTANVRGLTQAARNANDGISMAQTTEGAASEITAHMQRIRELTVQSANGSYSQEQQDTIQDEITQRMNDINRISTQTDFNGVKVLSANAKPLTLQVGANDGETISLNLTEISAQTLGLDGFNVNGKGIIQNSKATELNLKANGAATAAGGDWSVTTTFNTISAKEAFDKLKTNDNISIGGGGTVYTYHADNKNFSYDTKKTTAAEIASLGSKLNSASAGEFIYKNGTNPVTRYKLDNTGRISDSTGQAMQLDSATGALTASPGGAATMTQAKLSDLLNYVAGVSIAAAATTPGAASIAAATHALDDIQVTIGDVTYKSNGTTANLAYNTTQDKDSLLADLSTGGASAAAANTTISLSGTTVTFATAGLGGADQRLDYDGELTTQGAFDTIYHVEKDGLVTTVSSTGLNKYAAKPGEQVFVNENGKLTTKATTNTGGKTENAMERLDKAFNVLNKLTSELGAVQNRLDSTIANLNNIVNNLQSARSRILDADYATEVSNMSRAQILQQAGTSVLAQANQVPQTVLSLLR